MPIALLVASHDEHFREMVRENLLNIANARIVGEYPEITPNLYIRVLQDLERHPEAALVIDLAGETETALRALERTKQAAPDLYVIASSYQADGESVIAAVRAGANDFLHQPIKRLEFREAMSRLERAPRRAAAGTSRLGKIYSFLGVKGGVGTTTLAVNFAAALSQRGQHTVLIDLDWVGNDVAMQLGAQPQNTLLEIADNLSRMDQALFEGLVTRDPLGMFVVSPADSFEHRGYFTEPMFREFSAFLVEKYEAIVIDAGRWISDDVVMGALQVSNLIFLVITQEFPAIRNAQRYLGYLMRMGFTQDQIKVVINQYSKRPEASRATLEQVQQTLNQPVFYGIPGSPAVLASINRARPFVADPKTAGDLERAFRGFVEKATGARAALAKAG
ncbi:MAG: AAA family ATPase [Bryobacterales bacterium]|nr:AAA family ATPase [Bryobacterales bacterium]